MKLKLSDVESFSGLPNLYDENGVLVCVTMNHAEAAEIMKRVNAHDQLVAALKGIAEACNCCYAASDLASTATEALTAAGAA